LRPKAKKRFQNAFDEISSFVVPLFCLCVPHQLSITVSFKNLPPPGFEVPPNFHSSKRVVSQEILLLKSVHVPARALPAAWNCKKQCDYGTSFFCPGAPRAIGLHQSTGYESQTVRRGGRGRAGAPCLLAPHLQSVVTFSAQPGAARRRCPFSLSWPLIVTSARTARFTPSPAASASGPGRVRPRLARVPGHLARSGRGQPPWGCVAPGLETALRISASKIQRRGRGGPSARQCSASTVRWALCRGRGFEATPGPHCNSAGGAARVLLGVQFRRAARLVGWGR